MSAFAGRGSACWCLASAQLCDVLQQHLLRTRCTEVACMVARRCAVHAGVEIAVTILAAPLPAEERKALLQSAGAEVQSCVQRLFECLSGKSAEAFIAAVERHADVLDLHPRPLDKKRERCACCVGERESERVRVNARASERNAVAGLVRRGR